MPDTHYCKIDWRALLDEMEHRSIVALDKRIDQRFIDADKRHDERFVAQRDYNVQHNSLQRMMTEQAKEMVSKVEFADKYEAIKDRLAKLERWPWLATGLFVVCTAIMGIIIKLL